MVKDIDEMVDMIEQRKKGLYRKKTSKSVFSEKINLEPYKLSEPYTSYQVQSFE